MSQKRSKNVKNWAAKRRISRRVEAGRAREALEARSAAAGAAASRGRGVTISRSVFANNGTGIEAHGVDLTLDDVKMPGNGIAIDATNSAITATNLDIS